MRCLFRWWGEGTGKMISERISLVVYFLATIEGFVWGICPNCDAELFPGRAIRVSKRYREELMVRIGVF